MIRLCCLLTFLFLLLHGAQLCSPRPVPRALARRSILGVRAGRHVVFVGYMRLA